MSQFVSGRARSALAVYAIVTLLSFPHEGPAGLSVDLGMLFAWFGPAALIVGVAEQTPRRAMMLAFLASLVSHALLFHWFYVVTVQYGGMPAWIGFFSPLVPALYVSFFTAIFAWLWVRIGSTSRAPIWVGAMCWVAVDWARGHLMGGFPWATLGYALHLDWPLLAWTRWAGVYVLSFIAVAVGIAMAQAWLSRSRSSMRALGITLVAVAFAHAIGAGLAAAPSDADVVIRIAAIQGNIDQSEKWSAERRDRIFDGYLRLSREAAEKGAEWIVWPETAVPGLVEAEPEYAGRIGELARTFNVSLIVGGTGVEFDPVARRIENYFDSAFLFDSTGAFRDRYDKTHLVPFGEFVPLRDLFGRFFKSLATGLSNTDIRAGVAPRALTIHHADPARPAERTPLRVGVPICYELLFPDLVRRFGQAGAGVLLAMTNDAWYGRTGAPHQFLAMTALRAAENGRWLVRAANTGVSAIIDARGRVRDSTALFEESMVIADVPIKATAAPTIYARVGDVFAWICIVVTLACLALAKFKPVSDRESSDGPRGQEREA